MVCNSEKLVVKCPEEPSLVLYRKPNSLCCEEYMDPHRRSESMRVVYKKLNKILQDIKFSDK